MMTSNHTDSQNPSGSTVQDPSESSSIDLLANSPQRSTNIVQDSAKALKTLVGKFKSAQVASSSRPAKEPPSKDEPRAEILIFYD